MLGEVAEFTSTLTAALAQEGYKFRLIRPGRQARQVTAETYEVDFESTASLQQLHALLTQAGAPRIGAIFNFLGIASATGEAGLPEGPQALQATLWSFNVLKQFTPDLVAAATEGGGHVLNVTALGGRFGLGAADRRVLPTAGLVGLFKSLRQEHPTLSVRTVDIDRRQPNPLLVPRLLEEFTIDDRLVEVGLPATGRVTTHLSLSTPHASQLGPWPLDEHSVVLVTGGAYGITYDIAYRLAERSRSRLILVGRSPLPDAEGDETRDLDTAGLRQFLIQQRKASGQPLVPAQIEQNLKRMLKDRQILENLAAIEATGAIVEYHSLDVRDEAAFGGLLEEIYGRYGRIDGVLHGAGVIEDKLLKDKPATSFANVFSTKVDSALVLARKLRPETLKFLVFFSSVSGRFGNAGQTDYSAANEFLNKLADELAAKWPARVVAINWGAWDAGMVSEEIRRQFIARDLHMIPIPEGVRFLENELRLLDRREPEVTIACSIPRLTELVAQG